MKKVFAAARQNMVDSQLKPFNVVDTAILEAFANIKRENFIPTERQNLAYIDEDLPMGEGRFMIEPPAYAKLLQEVGLTSEDNVLDVGCLMGYTSAILSTLVKSVVATDENDWIVRAKKADKASKDNVTFVVGNLHLGSAQQGPYDIIVINGAVQTIPQALVNQLKDGGKIATFFRNDKGDGHAVIYHKHHGDLRKQILFDAFVPLLPGFEKEEGFVF